MKFIPLIWVNLKRKKMRTMLTIGSFAVALFLFGLLTVIHSAFSHQVKIAGADRLVVRNRISLIMPLPISYKQRLAQVSGVKSVTFGSWFGGVYQTERNFFPQFAIDSETYLSIFSEYSVAPEQWESFMKDRQGCLIGEGLIERFGWKIGDRIPIQGTIFPGLWEFNICGIFKGKTPESDTKQFWFHYKYLDERDSSTKGLVGWYYVQLSDPSQADRIAQTIDEMFANSPYETATETEKAFAAGFLKQMGNIQFVLICIGSVIFFTLLLITGSNMAIAVRERTNEIAVMKTLGFSGIRILFLILTESIIYAFVGGTIGLGLCKLYTLQGDPTNGMLIIFELSHTYIALGLGISAMVGFFAGIIPSCLAMRLNIVDAMRRI